MASAADLLFIDEEPLRDRVLLAYHEERAPSGDRALLADALREFLSGPRGGPGAGRQYRFEVDPPAALERFARSLDAAVKGLDRAALDPVLEAVAKREREATETAARGDRLPLELAPNLSLWVASRAGPIAVRGGIDETVAGALVAAWLLAVSRLGPGTVREAVASLGRDEPGLGCEEPGEGPEHDPEESDPRER